MRQIGPRGEKLCSGQGISGGQKDGKTDGQTDHYGAPAEQGLYNGTADTH